VRVTRLELEPKLVDSLQERLVLCYTGRSRLSGDTITRVMGGYENGDADLFDLEPVRELGCLDRSGGQAGSGSGGGDEGHAEGAGGSQTATCRRRTVSGYLPSRPEAGTADRGLGQIQLSVVCKLVRRVGSQAEAEVVRDQAESAGARSADDRHVGAYGRADHCAAVAFRIRRHIGPTAGEVDADWSEVSHGIPPYSFLAGGSKLGQRNGELAGN